MSKLTMEIYDLFQNSDKKDAVQKNSDKKDAVQEKKYTITPTQLKEIFSKLESTISYLKTVSVSRHEIALKVRAFRTQSYNICPSRQL